MPDRARRSVPVPRPATVGELATLTVVEAPAARVTEVPPLAAKKMDETCGTLDSERMAVRAAPLTFVTRKTEVNVRADGTVPKSRASESTLPLAIVPLSGVTEK